MAKYGITTLLERPADQPLNVVNVEMTLGALYAKLRFTLDSGTLRRTALREARMGPQQNPQPQLPFRFH